MFQKISQLLDFFAWHFFSLEFIRTQLQTVVNDLELFNGGVLLYQLENYQDAAAAFKEFSKVYPAREVLSNLGACYLNSALHRLHLYFGDDYYRFRLPTTPPLHHILH